MNHLARVRTQTHTTNYISSLISFEDSELLDMDQSEDEVGLLQWRDQWLKFSMSRPEGVDADDLLSVAICQGLEFAFDAWVNQGETINGNALLTMMGGATGGQHFLYENWEKHSHHFTSASMAPWHGVLFSHLSVVGRETLALGLIDSGLVTIDTPLPVRSADTEQWLFSHQPLELYAGEATLPLHLALETGRWELANHLQTRGADLVGMDGRGKTPWDAMDNYMDLRAGMAVPPRVADSIRNWRGKLQSHIQAREIENNTALIGTKRSNKRL